MFAILFEVLLIEIQEEIRHFAGWEGGLVGHKNCEQAFCEQTGVPSDFCVLWPAHKPAVMIQGPSRGRQKQQRTPPLLSTFEANL